MVIRLHNYKQLNYELSFTTRQHKNSHKIVASGPFSSRFSPMGRWTSPLYSYDNYKVLGERGGRLKCSEMSQKLVSISIFTLNSRPALVVFWYCPWALAVGFFVPLSAAILFAVLLHLGQIFGISPLAPATIPFSSCPCCYCCFFYFKVRGIDGRSSSLAGKFFFFFFTFCNLLHLWKTVILFCKKYFCWHF